MYPIVFVSVYLYNISSSYTANLAAFLTVDKMITPIENAEDLGTLNICVFMCVRGVLVFMC